jgi:small subunit ribosomal protein S4e
VKTMAKAHLKRIAVPKTWPILRKINPFIRRPNPGSMPLMYGMSISTWLCEVLQVSTTAAEARTALRAGSINVNGKKVKDPNHMVGLFDTISIVPESKHYLILLSKRGKMKAIEVPSYDNTKLSKITGKRKIAGAKTHYTTMEGYTIITEDSHKTGETVILNLNEKKSVQKTLELKKGAEIFMLQGHSAGKVGRIDDFVGEECIVTFEDKQVRLPKNVMIVVEGYTTVQEALKNR